MLKIYYTFDKVNSREFLLSLLKTRYGILDDNLLLGANGKPYLQGNPVYFSLSHSQDVTAVAVHDQPVGLDVEYTKKTVDYTAIFNRLSPEEQAEITGMLHFFYHWTAKESFVKYLGERLSKYYQKLAFLSGRLYLDGKPLPVAVLQGETADDYVYCVTLKKSTSVELIQV